jgi:hypothetical protein
VNRFVGSSLVVTTVTSYSAKVTVNTAYVTSHTKSSNSSSGHTTVPLELRNSSEVNFHYRVFPYPLGTDHAQKTQLYCCVAQTTQKISQVMTILPVHWRADYYLETSSKHSSYFCVTLCGCLLRCYLVIRVTIERIFACTMNDFFCMNEELQISDIFHCSLLNCVRLWLNKINHSIVTLLNSFKNLFT